MLSPLQKRLWRLVGGLPDAESVALAGGAALIVRGIVERPTRDLDFFATSPEEVNRLLPALEASLRESGLKVQRVQIADGFARLLVSSEIETTTIDLTWDARRFPVELSEGGAILAGEELAADKVLALFGRAAARDFVDVAALASRYGFERLCNLAAEKDPGFDRSVLADMLRSFDRLPRADFDLDDLELDSLRATVSRWRQQLEPWL
ncbi:MAG: nucleotidyl transferase AbiEii/AbiGii toxin family protein [Actinomycetota bacterium]